tara:strand:+ start:327 stop:521 length:195 start_codon:yes stop_codon:yes gene_type:complete
MANMNKIITQLISVDADLKWVTARFLEKRGIGPKFRKLLRSVANAQDNLVDRRKEDARRRSRDL